MQNVPRSERRLEGVEFSGFEVPVRRSKFDLAVFVTESAGGLIVHWLYSTALFNRETILGFARNWETVLQNAVADPEARLSAIDHLTGEEREKKDIGTKQRKQNQRRMLMSVEAQGVDFPAGGER
jgi:non-ribosomal peptide synthetase component F